MATYQGGDMTMLNAIFWVFFPVKVSNSSASLETPGSKQALLPVTF